MAMSSVPSAAATSVSGRNNTSTTLDPSKGDLGIGVTPRGRSLLSVWDDVVSFPAPGENDAVACGCPRCTSLAAKKKEEKMGEDETKGFAGFGNAPRDKEA